MAIAALDEMLKFAPPGGQLIPADALWSEPGRAVYAEHPGQFDVARVVAVREAYRRELHEIVSAPPGVRWPAVRHQDAPSEVGGFRFATVVDGLSSDGQSVASPQRGRIDDHRQRQRIRDYLADA